MSSVGLFSINMSDVNPAINSISSMAFSSDHKILSIIVFFILLVITGYIIYRKLIKVEERYR